MNVEKGDCVEIYEDNGISFHEYQELKDSYDRIHDENIELKKRLKSVDYLECKSIWNGETEDNRREVRNLANCLINKLKGGRDIPLFFFKYFRGDFVDEQLTMPDVVSLLRGLKALALSDAKIEINQ